ncbi:hypothetical protein MIZ03_1560 [Rhodoferax lithotrophicus]|uniref:Uncharacterized protein n=1 Tax=Rhodoferax lithotrophicus TaxID=2798804 RepID=A0ABN6D3U4_9BURK|nr:hypothetical protein MIZ03_1560 [Rhodoferax sp. MIZ03]
MKSSQLAELTHLDLHDGRFTFSSFPHANAC